MSYPRVLILGETFRLNGGGGITLTNLFRHWPSDKMAVVTERIGETSPDAGCVKFYQLGHLERKLPFPLNKIMKTGVSGEVVLRMGQDDAENQAYNKSSRIKSLIRDAVNSIFVFTGVYHFVYKTTVSPKLLNWIKDYSPDIIYGQPFRYSDMQFISEVQEKTSIPLAIHIMDDSISFLNKPNLLFLYWNKRTKTVFRQLINNSAICLSISKYMSEEYYKRYNKKFIPFRNPIEITQWSPYIKNAWEINGETKIVYTGRLAVPNINSLFRFCEVVDNLNRSGIAVKFDIFSIDDNQDFKRKVKSFRGINFNNPVPYTQIPKLIPEYDVVLLPIDFDKRGVKFARYSISTKTSEYMISGVPVLLFAPVEVALTAYAIENECMLSVSSDDNIQLKEALVNLINNKSLRESLAKKAIEVVKKDSDADNVRQEFKVVLSSISNL